MSVDIIQALNAGGNVALLACCWFMMKATERLARIEKALEIYTKHLTKEVSPNGIREA